MKLARPAGREGRKVREARKKRKRSKRTEKKGKKEKKKERNRLGYLLGHQRSNGVESRVGLCNAFVPFPMDKAFKNGFQKRFFSAQREKRMRGKRETYLLLEWRGFKGNLSPEE